MESPVLYWHVGGTHVAPDVPFGVDAEGDGPLISIPTWIDPSGVWLAGNYGVQSFLAVEVTGSSGTSVV